MAYTGSVELISGIRQKNGQDFPLVDASAVRVDDETRLDDALDSVDGRIAELPNMMDSNATGIDLDVTDQSGNVILRLQSGHIKTKNFDSSDVSSDLSDLDTTVTNLSTSLTNLGNATVSKNQGQQHAGEALIIGEDGNVTTGEAGVSVDTTLTESGKAADAKIVGDNFDTITDDIDSLSQEVSDSPTVKDSDAENIDLDITDLSGNVILRLQGGHVKTKNFDSSNGGTQDVENHGTIANSDIDFSDINGNVILRLANGHIQTKKFNSFLMRQLSDKKWTCIGDSLTEVNIRTTLHYHDYIHQETGIQIYNLGHSGCGYAKVGGYGKNFIGIAAEIPLDTDVITIFGSGNDMSAGLDLGTPTDDTTETLCGCMNATLDVIYANFPTTPIGIITPTPWANQEPSDSRDTMKNYCAALVQICSLRGIPCLDLYHCSNLHPTDVNFRPLAYSNDDGDGVHPDETGHAIIAPRMRQFLMALI